MKKGNKLKRLIFIAIALLMTLGMVAGCGSSTLNPETTLTVWTVNPIVADYLDVLRIRPDDKNALITKAIVDKFHETHPDIKVNLKSLGWSSDLNEALVRAYNSRTLPDIVVEEQYLASHKARNLLLPIVKTSEISTKFPELAGVDAKLLQPLTFGDDVYSTPVFTGVLGLFYNEELLTTYNVKRPGTDDLYIPATFSELLEASEMLYRNSNGVVGGTLLSYSKDGAAAYRALGFLRQAGAEILDTSIADTDPNYGLGINSKQTAAVYDYLNLLGNYGLPSWAALSEDTEINSEFHNGKAGFYIESNSYLYSLREVLVGKPFSHIKMTSLPECDLNGKTLEAKKIDGTTIRSTTYDSDATNPQNSNVFIGNVSYSLGNNESMKNATKLGYAMDFLKVMYDTSIQELMFSHDGRIPVLTSVFENLLNATADETDLDKIILESKPAFESIANDVIPGTVPSFQGNASDIWTLWTTNYRETTKKGSTYSSLSAIQTALNTLQTSIKSKMEE